LNLNPTSISEQLLFTTVRIDTVTSSGKKFFGTGFIVNREREDGKVAFFLVTNKHVIKDSVSGNLTFLAKKNDKPDFDNHIDFHYDNFASTWHGHPEDNVDVAVYPLGRTIKHAKERGTEIFFKTIPPEVMPSQSQLDELDALEEILLIGYPRTLRDEKNLLPIMRKGITATPATIDYEGKPIFLIDAPVFEGSSGSPVFIYNVGSYSKKGGGTVIGNRVFLLGIVSKAYNYFEESEIKKSKIKKTETKTKSISKTRHFIDIGVVYKTRTINETIDNALKTRVKK